MELDVTAENGRLALGELGIEFTGYEGEVTKLGVWKG